MVRKGDYMKFRFVIPVFMLLTAGLSFAQPYNDIEPFLCSRTLGGRADFVMFNSRPDYGFDAGYGFFRNDSALNPVWGEANINRVISTDGVSGNFLMGSSLDQFRDETVCGTMESVADTSIVVRLYVSQLVNGVWSTAFTTVDSLKKAASSVTQRMDVRMASGYFDGNPGKDFVVAYNFPDDNPAVKIRLFKLDSATALPLEITSIRDDTLPSNLGAQTYFDVAAGDYDGDGLHEICVVKSEGFQSTYGHTPATVYMGLKVYDFDWTGKVFLPRASRDDSWDITTDISKNPVLMDQVAVTAGDFNGDGKDEAAFGFSMYCSPGPEAFYIQPFSMSGNLLGLAINKANLVNVENSASQGNTAMSMTSGDIELDGRDELVYAGAARFGIYRLDLTLNLSSLASFQSFGKPGYMSHRRIAVGDVDGDTTFSDSSTARWYPEIITSEFTLNPTNGGYGGATNYHHVKVYKLTNPESFTLGLASDLVENYAGAISPTTMTGGGILLPYLRGNAIRLGKPKQMLISSLVEPVVILNAPPIHFDVIGDSTYDICKSYPVGTSTNFYSQYTKSTTDQWELTTNVHSDWGVSASLTYEKKLLGFGVKASIKAKYGESFTKSRHTDTTLTVTMNQSTTWDDRIFATVTDYALFEYPVYASGVFQGHLMAAVPHPKEPTWFPSNDRVNGNYIIVNHEPGNLLSYQNYDAPENDPDVDRLIAKGPWFSIDQTYSSTNSWGLTAQTLYQDTTDTTQSWGISASASVKAWGFKLETEGQYNRGSINTHVTTVSQTINMTAQFGAIDPYYTLATYRILPYAYWSLNGPLVLDYMVDLPTTGVGGSFWEANYSQKPDLAFNCYYRYLQEKNLGVPATLADWTKEIEVKPETPREGDTVTVLVKIHNYSLLGTTNPVQIRFYYGASETNGKIVQSLEGDTLFSTPSPVAARGDQVLDFTWRIPFGMSTSDTMLYAVIDPDNGVDELKENNNIGWNRLKIAGLVVGVREPLNRPSSFRLFQNYPNPFNPTTTIKYELPYNSRVSLKIYNLLGQVVQVLADGVQSPGAKEVSWNASKFSSGVYYYRLEAVKVGDPDMIFSGVRKLTLIK